MQMLKNWNPEQIPEKEDIKVRLSAARTRLYELQMALKEHKIPVIVLFEGWGASGKGSTISKVIKNIDPRFFKVATMSAPTEEELRKPFLYRYFREIPEAGKFTFLDSGWMDQTCRERMDKKLKGDNYSKRIDSIRRFERQLTDNGYVLLKFFMQIDRKEQEKRMGILLESKDTRWRVNEYDLWQNDHYKKCRKIFDQYMQDTNTSAAPWYIVDAGDRKWAELQVLETMISNIEVAMENSKHAVPILQNVFPLMEMPRLSEIPLDGKEVGDEEYKAELKELQAKLGSLHNRLYRKRVPVIITYEGWDAAGKGGAIRRLTAGTDARITRVIPISAPSDEELAHHYLWRFWRHIPRAGFITIYDRSWYGRVLVERVEKLTPKEDWARAYAEINHFEHQLTSKGNILLKFWLHISPEEQLRRFREREAIPWKRYKITDEDWRNRDKWPEYARAADEMFLRTSTEEAPWHVIPAENKKHARLMVLRIYRDALKRALR